MAGRCGPVCQHPGCWQSIDRQKIDKNKFTGYIEYLNNVVAKKKSRKVIERPVNYDSDGMPLLTIRNISVEGVDTVMSSAVPLHSNHDTTWERVHPQYNIVQYTPPIKQFLLKSSNPSLPPSHSTCTFTPVLLWRPNPIPHPPVCAEETHHYDENGHIILKTTDLTNSLPEPPKPIPPPPNTAHEGSPTKKASKSQEDDGTCTLDQYLVDGFSDMPPHIVKQIIQHLQSHSDVDVAAEQPMNYASDYSPAPPTTPITKLPSLASKEKCVPSSLILDLSAQKLHHTAPRLRKNRRSKTSSFSRTMEATPEDALTGLKQRALELQHKANVKPSQWVCHRLMETPKTRHNHSATFPSISDLEPPSTLPTGFSPRPLPKATLQRMSETSHGSAKNIPPITLPYDKLVPKRLSILVPTATGASAHNKSLRVFSEDVASSDKPDTGTGLRSETVISHASSDQVITGANMASQGNLLLLNREGQVILEVDRTDNSSTKVAQESCSPCGSEELLKFSNKLLTPDDGSIAPPPTALEARHSSTMRHNTPKPPPNEAHHFAQSNRV